MDPCLRALAEMCPDRLANAVVRFIPTDAFVLRAVVALASCGERFPYRPPSVWMGPQPVFRGVLQTTVHRALLLEPCESTPLCSIIDLPKSIMCTELAEVLEAFLDGIGNTVVVDQHNWCSIWLLLNSWIERGVVLPETWTTIGPRRRRVPRAGVRND